jgi:tetratricopeptide (TPR) repeat protein
LVLAYVAGVIGLTSDAVTAAEEALSIVRRLHTADGAQHAILLAQALTRLGSYLGRQQRTEEAEAVCREAVIALHPWAASGSPEILLAHADAQSELAFTLAESDPAEALTQLEESAHTLRQVAAMAGPEPAEPILAHILPVLVHLHLDAGQPLQAVNALEELADLAPRSRLDDEDRDIIAEALASVRDTAPDEVHRRKLDQRLGDLPLDRRA